MIPGMNDNLSHFIPSDVNVLDCGDLFDAFRIRFGVWELSVSDSAEITGQPYETRF